jgi:O-6-methylguanine DNA methyltransferase
MKSKPVKPVIIATCSIETTQGVFAAHYSADGLARLDFPGRKTVAANGKNGKNGTDGTNDFLGPKAPAGTPAVRRWHRLAARAVNRIFKGRAPGELPPLDVAVGTAFQRKVWAGLQRIPAGQTKSYGQLAAALGAPKAARAVGSACGANPIPLLIPCHRAISAGGGLGGFSGGLGWKRLLLALETDECRTPMC